MNLIGMTVGGLIAVYLLASLLEWALFKRVVDTPEVGKGLSVGFAALLAIILYGFGNANGGAWNPFPGGIVYLFAGAIVLTLMLWSYRRRKEALEEQAGLGDSVE